MLKANQWQFDMLRAVAELRDKKILDIESATTLIESICLNAEHTPTLDDLSEPD